MSQVDKSVISPRLRNLLVAIFFLFAILFVDAVYLSSITFLEWFEAIAESDHSELTAEPKSNYQGAFYQYAFLAHLILVFVVIIPPQRLVNNPLELIGGRKHFLKIF